MRSTLRTLAFLAIGVAVLPATGSTPASHDVTLPSTDGAVVTVTWTGTSPAGTAGAGSTCVGIAGVTQDEHTINLAVPAGVYDTVNVSAEFRIDWDDQSGNDLVLTLEQDGGNVGDSDGANGEGTSFESITKANPSAGTFNAIVCSFTAIPAQPYTGTLTLTATAKSGGGGGGGSGPVDTDGDGVFDNFDLCPGTPGGTTVDDDGCPVQAASGLAPRFQVHPSPPNLADDAGEPSIGFNPLTKHTMFISYTHALRQTYPELDPVRVDAAGDQLPQSCDATWEDKPGTLTTLNSLDPILFTDQATGRTFNSQLAGANSLFEYTDDDGDTWTPGQIGPPNGGADHQAVATGPYATALPTALWPATGPKRAVYYCSQSVATAFCSRSDDGGTTFGPGNTFKDLECAAGALHGHVKVSPTDGTVYVPDSSQCVLALGGTAEKVVAFRSTDNGVTFTPKPVPMSTGGDGSDPSIGIATDGTMYMCYTNSDATVHMAVSHDRGDTWTGGQDIGIAKGVKQARFPQAIAGDPDRGACAFLGTSLAGNGDSLDFQGAWYGFVATTYDGGTSYHTVNVTPHDPVQGYGGIGPDGTNRNLLDFNDLQLDDEGRTLFGFADGCTKGCVKDPASNAFAAKGTVVRQVGGRTLYAAFDDVSGTASANPRYNTTTAQKPTAACAREDLSKRSNILANVVWNAPDDGGSDITQYTVYRSTAPDSGFAVIGSTTGQTAFQDTATNPSVAHYYYKVEAENALGKAPVGNVIDLPISTDVVNTCLTPGELIIADLVGDGTADDFDIVSMAVAEPKEDPEYFAVTEKIANFSSGTPAATLYLTLFPNFTYFALNAATSGLPTFEAGTYQELPQGALAFTPDANIVFGPKTGYDADGTIRFYVPRSFFGNPAPGAIITGWDVRTRAAGTPIKSIDTAGSSEYVVRGTDICPDVGAVVLALLQATPLEGPAPLDVHFTLSGTPSPGKKLDTYTINFGEPNADPHSGFFDNAGSLQLSHRYAAPGTYRARLTVTDITGTASNSVEQTITVLDKDVVGNNKLGGALPLASVLLLGLAGLLRRRRR